MKYKDIPVLRARIQAEQNNICELCKSEFNAELKPVLDHDHKTGFIRGVLCVNCNGQEGRITNSIHRAKRDLSPQEWLQNYIQYHNKAQYPDVHPTFGAAKRRAQKKRKKKKKKKGKK